MNVKLTGSKMELPASSAISPFVPFSAWSAPMTTTLPRYGCHYRKINMSSRCVINHSAGMKETMCQKIPATFAAVILLNAATNQVIAADFSQTNSICQLASVTETNMTMAIDKTSDDGNGSLMMRGMTAKNFNPIRYSGVWYEVASLKGGFSGQGQEDCHCTQGVYTFDAENRTIQVDTFCVHGNPDGYRTGIRGKVQCLNNTDLEKEQTEVERQEMIREKCYLRFPSLPFIPKQPYNVIATDYDNYALVSGAKNKSFVQIYSRTPNPGPDFIVNFKSYLASLGFDPSQIKDTPQDCEVMPTSQLALMMSQMQAALTNQFPDVGLKKDVQLNPFSNVLDTFKNFLALYFK